MDDRNLQKVRVEIKVDDGVEYGAPVIANVTREQTIGGIDLGGDHVGDLTEFVREVASEAASRAVAEIEAQERLAAVRKDNASE